MTNNEINIKLIQEGDKLLQIGDFDGAEQKYHEALALDKNSAHALYSIGAVYSHRDDQKTAFVWAERAIAVDPNFKPGYSLLDNSLFGLNRYEEALEELALVDEKNLVARFQMGLRLSHISYTARLWDKIRECNFLF